MEVVEVRTGAKRNRDWHIALVVQVRGGGGGHPRFIWPGIFLSGDNFFTLENPNPTSTGRAVLVSLWPAAVPLNPQKFSCKFSKQNNAQSFKALVQYF